MVLLCAPFSAFKGTSPSVSLLVLTEEQMALSRFLQSLPAPQLQELWKSKMTTIFGAHFASSMPQSFQNCHTLIVVSTGPADSLTRESLRRTTHQGVQRALSLKTEGLVLAFGHSIEGPESTKHMRFADLRNGDDSDGAHILEAYRVAVSVIILSDWKFDGLITNASRVHHLSSIVIDDSVVGSDGSSAVAVGITEAAQIADCTCFTRNLANTRGDTATPGYMEAQARAVAEETSAPGRANLSVRCVHYEEMVEKGMGLIAAVGQCAVSKPRIVVLHYEGDAHSTDKRTLALVGKGVTFDTGGLNLKGSGNIETMYMDKHGACTVLGIMRALAMLQVKVNVVGVLACAENAIGAAATKPHEILKSYKGLTVQNSNTDAEGRLCLADAMTYVQREHPDIDCIFDFATLTGACVVALGSYAAGLFSNDDALAELLVRAGLREGEQVWPMPLFPQYAAELEHAQCDLRYLRYLSSMGKGPAGGACTAAAFLSHFVEPGKAWAHFDIAGAAMAKTANGHHNAGGNGWGVQLLVRYIQAHRSTEGDRAGFTEGPQSTRMLLKSGL